MFALCGSWMEILMEFPNKETQITTKPRERIFAVCQFFKGAYTRTFSQFAMAPLCIANMHSSENVKIVVIIALSSENQSNSRGLLFSRCNILR